MSSQYALIYFIHDDIGTAFENVLSSNILKATIPSTIKAYLIFNRRIVTGSLVRYKTVVSEIVTTGSSSTTLNHLSNFDIWEEAFKFVFSKLRQQELDQRVSLIALSHAGGIVINKSERIPSVLQFYKNKNLSIKLKSKSRIDNHRYIIKPQDKHSIILCTKTIVTPSASKNVPKNAFRKRYIRKKHVNYCKNYEGLFTFQLSKFFREQLMKFEFIIFSNCNILVYDNGYLFASHADFIIGAETNNNMGTWDFSIIIQTINNNLNTQPEPRVKQIFSACLQRFSTTDLTYRYFLAKSDKFPSLHILFEKIIGLFLKEIKEIHNEPLKKGLLNWVRWARATNDDNPLFDSMVFFREANQLANSRFTDDLNAFAQMLQTNIIIGRNSSDSSFCGFSLYLPRTKHEFESKQTGICNYFNQEDVNPFALASAYESFLTALYG